MNDPIWSPKISNGTKQACCKIPYKGYEISIAMDDSCGTHVILCRSDIRVFRDADGADITDRFTDASYIVADAYALKVIFKRIDEMVGY